jgi:hypothetical protein
MKNEEPTGHPKNYPAKAPKPFVSRTRLVMFLLLLVAVPIFIGLANKVVHENGQVLQQILGQ